MRSCCSKSLAFLKRQTLWRKKLRKNLREKITKHFEGEKTVSTWFLCACEFSNKLLCQKHARCWSFNTWKQFWEMWLTFAFKFLQCAKNRYKRRIPLLILSKFNFASCTFFDLSIFYSYANLNARDQWVRNFLLARVSSYFGVQVILRSW